MQLKVSAVDRIRYLTRCECRFFPTLMSFFVPILHCDLWLAVWLSGNALASINVVALRQTRLVLVWVTVCGRVNHFGM